MAHRSTPSLKRVPAGGLNPARPAGFARAEPAIACAIHHGWLKRLNSLNNILEPNPPTLGSTKEVDAWLTVSGKLGTNAEGVP